MVEVVKSFHDYHPQSLTEEVNKMLNFKYS
jgi:hypothetical protein